MTHRIRRGILALATLITCATHTLIAQTGTLRGTVTDAATHLPLAGVRIEATPPGTFTITDDAGRFRLAGTSGAPRVRATRIGYRPVEVQATDDSIALSMQDNGVPMEPLVVSASRSATTSAGAPTAASVIDRPRMDSRTALNSIEYVRATPGMDLASKGLIQNTYAVRGDRGSVSGALLTLTDYRNADVPSLSLNIPYLFAFAPEDLERIEVIRGPGAALYGPGADRGVLQFFMRSPFESAGGAVTVTGGGRDVFGISGRFAAPLGNRLAFKLSGEYLRGTDWPFVDPVEAAARAGAIAAGATPDTLHIGRRNPTAERAGGEARLDWRPDQRTEVIAAAGLADALHVVELGGDVGSVQADGWSYGYTQLRVRRDRFFGNVFYNRSSTGSSYLLRTGSRLVDSSRVAVAQLQHGHAFGRVDLLYGADMRWTDPRTGGTIDGENEDRDRITELGAYVHGTAALGPRVELIAALRADHHSRLGDAVLSPRAGIVFQPTPSHALRLTINRAFSSPDANTLSADLVWRSLPGVGTPVRASSVPRGGLTFDPACGGLCAASAFDPTGPHAIDAPGQWPALVAFLQSQGVDLSGLPVPTAAQVGTGLARLDITNGTFQPIAASDVTPIAALRRTITSTVEMGWKGRFGPRGSATVDVFGSRLTDVTGSRYVATPNVFYDQATLQAYLANFMPAAQAAAVAAAAAQVPVATVSPRQTTHPGDLLVLSRQGASYNLWGVDVGAEAPLSARVMMRGSASWLSRNTAVDPRTTDRFVLGVPRRKASVELEWRPDARWSFAGATRWVDGFDVNSGVYVGHVTTYSVVDLHAALALPIAGATTLAVDIQNALDNRHQEFVGAPSLGRLILTRIRTELR